jgi:hypothetical protein
MLKLSINDDDFTATITENDRGEWEVVDTKDIPGLIIKGFGGENYIYIIITPMQSYRTSVTVVFQQVDGPAVTTQRDVQGFIVTGTVNEIIKDWYGEIGIIETDEELQARIANASI